jgi:hypothetical protein
MEKENGNFSFPFVLMQLVLKAWPFLVPMCADASHFDLLETHDGAVSGIIILFIRKGQNLQNCGFSSSKDLKLILWRQFWYL